MVVVTVSLLFVLAFYYWNVICIIIILSSFLVGAFIFLLLLLFKPFFNSIEGNDTKVPSRFVGPKVQENFCNKTLLSSLIAHNYCHHLQQLLSETRNCNCLRYVRIMKC